MCERGEREERQKKRRGSERCVVLEERQGVSEIETGRADDREREREGEREAIMFTITAMNNAHEKVSVELQSSEPLSELATPNRESSNIAGVNIQIVRNSYFIEHVRESGTNFKSSFPNK